MKKKLIILTIAALLGLSNICLFFMPVNAGSAHIEIMSTRLPSPRCQGAAVWDGSNAYFFGGGNQTGPMNQILRYNPSSNTITTMSATLLDPVTDPCAVWSGQYVYLFGGYKAPGSTSDKISRYNPTMDTITEMSAKLPTYSSPLYSVSAVWTGNEAFLFGGYDGGSYYDLILKYDPTLDQTTIMTEKLPFAVKWTSAVWTGNCAYIFGGRTASGISNNIIRYDPAAHSVTTMSATLPDPVFFTSAVWTGTYAFMFGGGLSTSGRVISNKITRYDPALNECTTVEVTLPSSRDGTSAIWNGQSAFIFGGLSTDNIPFDEILRFSTSGSSLSAEPNTGFASTTIVGSSFSNTSRITVFWDETAIPTIPNRIFTDASGNFTALICVPTQTAPGSHTIKATDSLGNSAIATFTVVDMTGSQGATGEQGPAGPKGDTGSAGPQGPPGNMQDLLVMLALPTIVSVLAICLATAAVLKKKA
jgi:hypothetical protein